MKRFTDTNKWGDKWYRRLEPMHKHAWDYLCDQCDAAGVIDLDQDLADFQIGAPVPWGTFFEAAGKRIRTLENGKLWLVTFIPFQYGELKDTNNLHRSVMGLLEKHGIDLGDSHGMAVPLPCANGSPSGDQVKVKVKEEVKETLEGGCKGETELSQDFESWWSSAPKRVGRQAASKAYSKAAKLLRSRGHEDPHGFLLERIQAFSSSPKGQGEFCPYPATWLNEGRYDDDPMVWQDPGGRGSPRAAANASKASHVYDPSKETRHEL